MGGIISGIGSAIGGIASAIGASKAQKSANEANLEIARQNNDTSIRIARENNELQRSMMRENNEFNRQQAIDMFNLETSYNSPLAQVKRFQEAGLNPAIMMEGAGGSASGNSSASAPTAASSGISPSMPTLTTPRVEAVPPFSMGFLQALSSIADIQLSRSQARKTDSERNRIDEMLDFELDKLFADTQAIRAQTAYQELQTSLETQFGKSKRMAELRNLVADYNLALLKGETEKADAKLKSIEYDLTFTKNAQLKDQAPVILENLRKQGALIDEQRRTEKSKQSSNYAAAGVSEEQSRLFRAQHDDLVKAQKYAASKSFQEYREMVLSMDDRLEKMFQDGLVSKYHVDQVREAVALAKKENSWYHWNQAFDKLERTNRAVNSWFSLTNY